jgi:hypothetical protein
MNDDTRPDHIKCCGVRCACTQCDSTLKNAPVCDQFKCVFGIPSVEIPCVYTFKYSVPQASRGVAASSSIALGLCLPTCVLNQVYALKRNRSDSACLLSWCGFCIFTVKACQEDPTCCCQNPSGYTYTNTRLITCNDQCKKYDPIYDSLCLPCSTLLKKMSKFKEYPPLVLQPNHTETVPPPASGTAMPSETASTQTISGSAIAIPSEHSPTQTTPDPVVTLPGTPIEMP